MKKNSVKNIKINEEVMRELADIIRRKLKDPRVSNFCSVMSVEVAPDLKTAKAYISVLGNQDDLQKTIDGLKSSAGFIRHELARTVNLRNTPEIEFIPDSSIAYGVHMSQLIDEVNHKEEEENDQPD